MENELKELREAVNQEVVKLVKKAGKADKAVDALQYSQAACNTANALASIVLHKG